MEKSPVFPRLQIAPNKPFWLFFNLSKLLGAQNKLFNNPCYEIWRYSVVKNSLLHKSTSWTFLPLNTFEWTKFSVHGVTGSLVCFYMYCIKFFNVTWIKVIVPWVDVIGLNSGNLNKSHRGTSPLLIYTPELHGPFYIVISNIPLAFIVNLLFLPNPTLILL